ncbi:hypothetical protein StoSoilB5_22890 [Arthrobacter sp. StoSoilB5]|nr:hypothetical protein StoSoilB5_22890 [Arthrobacter sp. StoSoilB5]
MSAEIVTKLLEVLDDLIRDARETALSTNPDTELGRFDRGAFERCISVIHAARVLVKAGHWETATSPVRQLYEIVLNMEHLNTYPDRELAAIRFIRLGSLQEALATLANLEYEHERGERIQVKRVLEIRQTLQGEAYTEFRAKPRRDGSPQWRQSWCGKNIAELARESTNRLHHVNYKLLYSAWSEQTHGSPGALLPRVMDSIYPERIDPNRDEFESEMRVILMALVLFRELWTLLPGMPPQRPAASQEQTLRMNVLAEAGKSRRQTIHHGLRPLRCPDSEFLSMFPKAKSKSCR